MSVSGVLPACFNVSSGFAPSGTRASGSVSWQLAVAAGNKWPCIVCRWWCVTQGPSVTTSKHNMGQQQLMAPTTNTTTNPELCLSKTQATLNRARSCIHTRSHSASTAVPSCARTLCNLNHTHAHALRPTNQNTLEPAKLQALRCDQHTTACQQQNPCSSCGAGKTLAAGARATEQPGRVQQELLGAPHTTPHTLHPLYM